MKLVMGREIRMVPANWEHPQKEGYNFRKGIFEKRYKPMHDSTFVEAIDEWIADYTLWKHGMHPDQLSGKASDYGCTEYTEWEGGPPNPEYYRPAWKKEDMTWFQVYETVSEGTPVTPPFATREELVEYLVENGDFWDQSRRKDGYTVMDCEPWSREAAQRFVFGSGWAPSMVILGGTPMRGTDFMILA